MRSRLTGLWARWSDSSLRTRLIVLTTLAFLLILAAVAFVSSQLLQASVSQALGERQVLAQLMAERVEAQLVAAQRDLGEAVQDERLDLEDGDMGPEEPWLNGLYDSGGLFKRIILLDPRGNVLLVAPPSPDLATRNMAEPPYGVRLPLEPAPLIQPGVGFQSGMPGLRMIQPIHSPKGGTVGYLLGWVDTGDPRALPLLYPYAPGQGGFTDLVDESGRVLLSSEPSRVGLATDHAGHFAALVRARTASAGTCHTCHDQGLSRDNDLLAFAPLRSVPWGIALRQPESQVFAMTQNFTRDLAALALSILVVFTGLVSISTRSLARPLESLSRACREIAAGDLTHPIQVGGVAETKALASSFETMRQDLLAYRTQTEDARRELEHRVDERTVELRQVRDHLLSTNRNLVALNAVAAILSQSLDLRDTLDVALSRALQAVGAECGLLYVRISGGAPVLAAHHGLNAAELDAVRRLQSPDSPPTSRSWWAPHLGEADAYAELARALSRPRLVCVPLEARGEELGRICIAVRQDQGLSEQDQALLTSIAAQMALAVRNAGLYDELQREESARAELLHKVIVAQEDERKRIARELHDETSQAITALMLGLDTAGLALAHSPAEAEARLAATRSVAEGMLQNIHRLISDLRPALLDDLGLLPAISWYAEQRLNPLGIAFHLKYDGVDHRLPPDIETAVFRVVQEAVTNVVRHAGAANIWVTLVQHGDLLSLQVRDDGKGIDGSDRPGSGSGGGVGLRGMRERVNLLGGDFELESAAGQGTEVTIRLPLRGLEANGAQAHREGDPGSREPEA